MTTTTGPFAEGKAQFDPAEAVEDPFQAGPGEGPGAAEGHVYTVTG